MAITISFDLEGQASNHRARIKKMFMAFHWRYIGGSVYRYDGTIPSTEADNDKAEKNEDWLNHVVPALMYFRSYLSAKKVKITRFSIDAHSVAMFDQKDPADSFGIPMQSGKEIELSKPIADKPAWEAARKFISDCTAQANVQLKRGPKKKAS